MRKKFRERKMQKTYVNITITNEDVSDNDILNNSNNKVKKSNNN